MGYGVDWGFDLLEAVNLFAWRSTEPKNLRLASDPIGPDNNYWLLRAIGNADLVMCGWGSAPIAAKRAADIFDTFGRLFPLNCLGVTQSGMPLHPLYQPKSARPVPWRYPT